MDSVTKGFNLILTPGCRMPEISYINEIAREKGIEFTTMFTKAPPLLVDLYYIYTKLRDEEDDFDIKNHLIPASTIELNRMEALNEAEIAYYAHTFKFLIGLSYDLCPGFTPMDKALNTIMYMTRMSSRNDRNPNDTTNDYLDEFFYRIIGINPNDLDGYINEFCNGIGVPGTDVNQRLSQDLLSCIRDYYYDLNPIIANIYSKDKMESIPINKKILRDIAVKSYIEDKVGLTTSKSTKMIEETRSNQSRNRPLQSYDQITKVPKVQTILPNFEDKFIRKEVGIRQKMVPETKKQIIVQLQDDSGSMRTIIKQSYVRAVLLNRLESVCKGNAELEFYYYATDKYGYRKITNLEESKALFEEVSKRLPSQGGTNIGAVLQSTIDDICDDPRYVNPEIVIVLDGDETQMNIKY